SSSGCSWPCDRQMQLGSDAEAVGKSVPNAGRVPASAILLSETTSGGALIDPNRGSNRDEKATPNRYGCAVDGNIRTGATNNRRVRRLRSPPRLPGQLGHIHPKRDRLLSCKLCFNPGNAELRRSSHRTALRWLQKGPPPMKKLGVVSKLKGGD